MKMRVYQIASAVFLLALALNISCVFAEQAASGNSNDESPSGLISALPTDTEFYINFYPINFQLVPPKGSYMVTVDYDNTGTSNFKASGCKLTITWSNSKTVKGTCSISAFTFKAETDYPGRSWTFALTKKEPEGFSTWTVVITGTVNGKKMQSEPGSVFPDICPC